MLIPFSQLAQKPVKSLDTNDKIGLIENIVVEPDSGRIIAFVIKTGFLIYFKTKLLSTTDITGYTPDFLIVRDSDSLVLPEEIFKAKKIIEQKIFVLGAQVKTQSGKLLGKCVDVLIHSQAAQIIKFYVRPISLSGVLAQDRIIPIEQVISIKPGVIVVKDDVIKAKAFKKILAKQKLPAEELAGATG